MRKILLASFCTFAATGMGTVAVAQERGMSADQATGRAPVLSTPARAMRVQPPSATDTRLQQTDNQEVKKSTRVETGKEATPGATAAPGL